MNLDAGEYNRKSVTSKVKSLVSLINLTFAIPNSNERRVGWMAGLGLEETTRD